MPPFLCRYQTTVTLAAGVAQTVDVPVAGARDWHVVLANTGAASVTSLSLASSPLGVTFGESTAVTEGIPIDAGESLSVRGAAEPVTTLRLALVSASGTTVGIEAGGW
jgi:hypothetical protein